MTPILLLPAALAALAALAIPLVIHLARKTEQRPTDFAALRWLRERPRPRHRPRLDEWPLLLARLLLLALLALWLARPAVFGATDTIPVVAVAPGIDIGGVKRDGVRAVWLAAGFPDLATTPPRHVPIASLVRQLDAELPPRVRLRVIVPEMLQGADAERPRLTRTVDWQIVPGAMAAAPPQRAAAPAIAIRSASRHIAAAAAAWGARDIGGPDRAVGDDITALAWIGPGPMPAAVQAVLDRGGTVLLDAATPIGDGAVTPAWRDALGSALVERVSVPRGRLLRFTRPLVPASMPQLLEPDFPRRLRLLFAPDPIQPARVAARNHRPLSGATPFAQPATDLRPWWAVAIAALFLLERLLATRRTRAAAP